MSPSKGDPNSGSSTRKIAIKGFSLSKTSTKPKSTPPSSLGKRPRSTFAHDEDSGSEHEGTNGRHGKHEVVTGFGEGGAIRHEEKRKAEPLVISKVGNRDWRGEARAKKGKNLLPPEVQVARDAAAKGSRDQANGNVKKEGVDMVNSNDAEISWGLTVRKREKAEEGDEENKNLSEAKRNGKTDQAAIEVKEVEPAEEKSMDQEALEALMGTRKEKKGPNLVISAVVESADYEGPISEQDAYKRAIASAPDVSTLEDYERIPVEEFGAALLRGMGWKGEKQGHTKEVKRRQNLLGLGAKELKDAEELGAWVQKTDVKRLNGKGGGGGGFGSGERRPKASEYRREKERRDERREERFGGSYRKERERDRDSGRDRDKHRDRDDFRRR